MPQKAIKQNLGLRDGLITDQRTTQVANWFISLMDELVATAPPGCHELSTAVAYRMSVSNAMANYLAHRKADDPERVSTHRTLMTTLVSALREMRLSLHSGRDSKMAEAVPTQEQYESYTREIISSGVWRFNCNVCRHTWLNTEIIDGQRVCKLCAKDYVHECQKCGARHLTKYRRESLLVPLIDESGKESWYCKSHTPKGTRVCDHCGSVFSGKANSGHKQAAAMTAQGICACAACAWGYRIVDCGHFTWGDGNNRPRVEHTEDDNRNGERLRELRERVCDKCHVREEEESDAWPLAVPRLQGTVFTKVGSLRTFGVELEFCRVQKLPSMSESIKNYWTAKADGSLPRDGVEFASTVLQGDEGLAVVKDLCEYAEDHGWAVDARSGFHLHIGLTKDSVTQVANIAMGYTMTYDLWRLLVPPGRTTNCKYCIQYRTTAKELLKLDYNRYAALITERNDRRVWCNWHAYKQHATVELRLHSGTRNYTKVANWVKAHTRFCDWCAAFDNPKLLYERLHAYERKPRELLLILGQEAWKDRELARWFRERSVKLHGEQSPLRSHRTLRKTGIDPKAQPQAPPKATVLTYKGRAAYPQKSGPYWYILDVESHQGAGEWRGVGSSPEHTWTKMASRLRAWNTQEEAVAWLQENADGVEPAGPWLYSHEIPAPAGRSWFYFVGTAGQGTRRVSAPTGVSVEFARRLLMAELLAPEVAV